MATPAGRAGQNGHSGKPEWLHIGEVRGPDPLSVLDILVRADLSGLDDDDEINRRIEAVPTVFVRGIKIWGPSVSRLWARGFDLDRQSAAQCD